MQSLFSSPLAYLEDTVRASGGLTTIAERPIMPFSAYAVSKK